MPRLRDRPTPDLIVVIFTIVIAFEVIIVTIVAVGGLISGHGSAVKELLQTMGDFTNALIALVVGYVAGRGVNGNGKTNGTKPPPGDTTGGG